MTIKIKINPNYIFCTLLFVTMVCFFYKVHPLLPFDGDDWVNIGNMRTIALPKWGDFNPSKVFPETAFPTMGLFGAYVLVPLMGEYLSGVTMASALFMAGIVTVYVGMFNHFIEKVFCLKAFQTIPISIVFLLLHFLVLKTGDADNLFLFYASNTTCYYHYVAPCLINASFVMYFLIRQFTMSRNGCEAGINNVCDGILSHSLYIFLLYLAIFSNILSSIILVACLVSILLLEIVQNRVGLRYIYSNYKDHIWIIIAWFVSLLFEASGGRAKQIGSSLVDMPIMDMIAALFTFAAMYKKGLLITAAVLLLFCSSALYLYHRNSKKAEYAASSNALSLLAKYSLLSASIWLVYGVLVSAKAGSPYFVNTDVILGLFFYIFLLAMSAAAFCLAVKPKLYYAVPIIVLIMFSRTANQDGLRQSVVSPVQLTVQQAIEIDRDIIQQCIFADKSGIARPEIHVPKWSKDSQSDNWPHPYYRAATYMQTLYYHGVINRYYENVKLVPDLTMNEKYHIGEE